MNHEEAFPINDDILELEWQELYFQRKENSINYLPWKVLARRIKLDKHYRIRRFQHPEKHTGKDVLKLAYEKLIDRSCTFIDRARQVPATYQIPVEDLWDTFRDPKSGRVLVCGHAQNYWDLSFLIGANKQEAPNITKANRRLEAKGTSVEELAIRIMVHRCEQTGVCDWKAADESIPMVELALASAMESPLCWQHNLDTVVNLIMPRGSEAFDKAYSMARMRRAGVDLDMHPEYKSLQVFFEMGMKPPTHKEAADKIIKLLGNKRESSGATRKTVEAPSKPTGHHK